MKPLVKFVVLTSGAAQSYGTAMIGINAEFNRFIMYLLCLLKNITNKKYTGKGAYSGAGGYFEMKSIERPARTIQPEHLFENDPIREFIQEKDWRDEKSWKVFNFQKWLSAVSRN